MGDWEGFTWEVSYGEEDYKDEKLKEFRTKGLVLKNNGITLKIFPRFKSFMVDWLARENSKSAIFWHGVKDRNVLSKFWKVQKDDKVFPKCEIVV